MWRTAALALLSVRVILGQRYAERRGITFRERVVEIGYAKRTEKRVLAATQKRHAHRLANERATDVQNEQQKTVQNEQENKAA
jgi:hypothetical protein